MRRDITLIVTGEAWPPGDVTHDSLVNTRDIVLLVLHVFKGGSAPYPACYGDVDLSGSITATDILYVVSYVFKSGAPPLDACFGTAQEVAGRRPGARE
jgi:hypothetical protein